MRPSQSVARRLPASLAVVGLLAILIGQTALASGSYPIGGQGAGGADGYYPDERPQRLVDELYEFGKAVYLGRAQGVERIEYCVLVDGKPKKLKRRTLAQYKAGHIVEFANALLDCNAPDRLALRTMKEEYVRPVLYYLNKRYQLDLKT